MREGAVNGNVSIVYVDVMIQIESAGTRRRHCRLRSSGSTAEEPHASRLPRFERSSLTHFPQLLALRHQRGHEQLSQARAQGSPSTSDKSPSLSIKDSPGFLREPPSREKLCVTALRVHTRQDLWM
jgi:hypothetical protein